LIGILFCLSLPLTISFRNTLFTRSSYTSISDMTALTYTYRIMTMILMGVVVIIMSTTTSQFRTNYSTKDRTTKDGSSSSTTLTNRIAQKSTSKTADKGAAGSWVMCLTGRQCK
jgi:uncharacterized membrane protein